MIPPGMSTAGLAASGSGAAGLPYCGRLEASAAWYLQFNLDPLVIAVLAAAALWASRAGGALRRMRLIAAGIAAVLWLSPLCPASATLLSLRAAHHLGVMLVLAPVLALGWPAARTQASAQGAGLWALASAASFAVWFWPAAYTAAWQSDAIYWGLQLAMLGAAMMFWRVLFALAEQGRALASVAPCALASAAMGAVGAVLTFAPRVLLVEHQASALGLGIAPLADQQLAGLFVWVFGMVPIAAFALHAMWRSLAPVDEAAA